MTITFATQEPTLAALGDARHLGADPGLAPLHDAAALGMAWGALAGFYHAVALMARRTSPRSLPVMSRSCPDS